MNAIGVDFGRDRMPADESNAAGYWESEPILQIHEKILEELNRTWRSLPLPFLSTGGAIRIFSN